MAPIDTRVDIETPEHVRFRWEVAGIGPRAVAWAIDMLIRVVVVVGLAIPLGAASAIEGLDGVGSGAFMLALFLLDWAWFTVFESLPGGASPGKRVMGLRVVRDDGAPAGLREVVLRNLLRAADAAPAMYVVGLAAMAVDPRFRRLGDRVAGTIVVVDQRVASRVELPTLPPPRHEESRLLPTRLRLSARLRRAIEGWLAARPRMGATW
ncbi:MAG: RDD family protein, partial [Deltaproteobacteria bacterium]|nr:RDD family protein [Deltaproteobacteria bacterium]